MHVLLAESIILVFSLQDELCVHMILLKSEPSQRRKLIYLNDLMVQWLFYEECVDSIFVNF